MPNSSASASASASAPVPASSGGADPFAVARRTAVPALLVVVAEATLASLFAFVPALATLHPAGAPWVPAVAAALVACGAIVCACLMTSTRALVAAVIAALASAVAIATLPSASLHGVGLAFAAPLVVGEVLAAGVWIATSKGKGEKRSAALSLLGAALTSCVAAFLVDGLFVDVTIAPLAVAVGGVLAQMQLAAARIGESRAAVAGEDAATTSAARFAGVARIVLLAMLGRSGAQEDV